MDNPLVVIPAIKKIASIPDQLIKKLNGRSLIQRSIDTAIEFTNNANEILIITDSDEIALVAQRNKISFNKDKDLFLDSENIFNEVLSRTKNFSHNEIIVYMANTPLITSNDLKAAYEKFLETNNSMIVSVKKKDRKIFSYNKGYLNEHKIEKICEEIGAFYIFNKHTIIDGKYQKVPFFLKKNKSIEILNYQNWWICEKLLKRKRIVFHIFGSFEIGTGHIFHSLALAHEITDHEILFVCNEIYSDTVKKIISIDYKVKETKNIERTIIDLKPDMVINHVLNTKKEFIRKLKKIGSIVVNFEDLGSGSKYADLVFNDLYEIPLLEGSHYFWGNKYLTLRDEFETAKPNKFLNNVNEVLIIFGGSDQNNLTLTSLKAISDICKLQDIFINIVCGPGYLYHRKLSEFINSNNYTNIKIHKAILNISSIMENCQIAISSNGRTIYELAEMNIPSIVISHHKRESSHNFAKLNTGFLNIGAFNKNIQYDIFVSFKSLLSDRSLRRNLYLKMRNYSFIKGKSNVIKKILDMLLLSHKN